MANGLINLQTDLKSLRYGSDKPYITKNIGQAPGSQIGLEVQHRIDDTSRIAQMLVDRPGIKYLLHEAELHQVGVAQRIKKAQQGGKSIAGAVLGELGHTILDTVKIAGSTLAQVAVNGTGTHFLKGFRNDTYLQPENQESLSAFASFFGAGGVEGAPYALRGETIPGIHKTELTDKPSTYDYDDYLNVATGSNQAKLNAQAGTPITVIPSGSQATDTTLSQGSLVGSIPNKLPEEINPTDKTDKFPTEGISGKDTQYEKNDPTKSTYIVQKQNYKTLANNITKEQRVRLGDQGAATKEKQEARRKNQYWIMSDDDAMQALEVDKINALGPQDGKVGGTVEGRDLIKLRFYILTADGKEKVLYFRAFLDSFADNYTGQWNPVKYLGRAEDFQVYSGFQRKISLSFKIAAATRVEMKPIYEKMIWLASATAPTYANSGQFMRGTITKITLGDYIYELPGVLNSVNYAWNTEYPWEIAMVEPEKTGQDDFEQELPMVMDCSIDFTPIHTFTPTAGLRQYITSKQTEKGKKGIANIDNAKTGIEPTPTGVK